MKQEAFKLSYDKASDTFYVDLAEPYPEQDSRSVAKGVVARFNPESHRLETLEILGYSQRFKNAGPIENFISLIYSLVPDLKKELGLELEPQP